MIFSPWGPYQDRAIPGSVYDSAKLRPASLNFGGIDAVRLPHYVEIFAAGATQAVLERRYGLNGAIPAEALQIALGSLYGTPEGDDLIDRGFWWFFDSVASWNDAEAVVLYEQIAPGPTEDGERWYLACGVEHVKGRDALGDLIDLEFPGEFTVPEWRKTWSAWFADDVPQGGDVWPTITVENDIFVGYPLYIGVEAEDFPDARSGFRTLPDFDLLRGATASQVSPTSKPPSLELRPWTPGLKLSSFQGVTS